MERKSWTYWIAAALVVVAGGLMVAFAGDRETRQQVEIVIDDACQSYSLEDFAEGEARTFQAGEHVVVVTRRGDRLEVLLDGEPVAAPHASFQLGGDPPMTWITSGGETELETDDGFSYVFVTREEGDDDQDRVVVKVKEHVVTSKDGELILHPSGTEHAPRELLVSSDATVFRCPEDDTTLRVATERVTAAGFTCPVCGRSMEKLEGARMRVIEIRRREDGGRND